MRKLFFVNLALTGIAIFFGFRLYVIWASPSEEALPSKKKAEVEKTKTDSAESQRNMGAYQIIAQKDLFRPSRTEWKVEGSKSPQTPPPKLFGIMITDKDKVAILEDPSTNKRKTYRTKDRIGSFVVSEIENNKVILMRGEERVVVSLREIKTLSQPRRPGALPARPGALPPRPVPRSPAPAVQRPPLQPMPGEPMPMIPEMIDEPPEMIIPIPEPVH